MENLILPIMYHCWILRILIFCGTLTSLNAQTSSDLFNSFHQFFSEVVIDGKVNYEKAKSSDLRFDIKELISKYDVGLLDDQQKKAYLINVYNFSVIDLISNHYPIPSVKEISQFFTKKQILMGEQLKSLDDIEKSDLLSQFKDVRLHLILNCGAVDCPPLSSTGFFPSTLDDQIEEQVRIALNDRRFVKVNALDKTIGLSKIFKWYAYDFGSLNDVLTLINRYRDQSLPEYKVDFYEYDWSINDVKMGDLGRQNSNPNQSRYIVSSTIPKGSVEIKWFNNLYSEVVRSSYRSSYFTSQLSAVYGIGPRLSLGFDVRFRSVANGDANSALWNVLHLKTDQNRFAAIANAGPKIRWAPVDTWSNFSIQSALWWPLEEHLEGTSERPFLDWNGPIWLTQFFNDFDIGTQFSLFLEGDILLEDLGQTSDRQNYFSTPLTAIFSYFPTRKWSIYTLANIGPRWLPELDAFAQGGVGMKYQFIPSFEIEALVTYFTNAGLIDRNGHAATFNIGFRYSQ